MKVGDTFRVQVFVDDLRTTDVNPPSKGGVFAAALDIGYNDPSLFVMGSSLVNGKSVDEFDQQSELPEFKSFFTTHKLFQPDPDNPGEIIITRTLCARFHG